MTTPLTYQFNQAFREKILSLCLSSDFLRKYGNELIKPEYFELTWEQSLCTELIKFYNVYETIPDFTDISIKVDEKYHDNIRRVFELNADTRLAQDEIIKFAKRAKVQNVLKECVIDGGRYSKYILNNDINKFTSEVLDKVYDDIAEDMGSISTIGQDLDDFGTDFKKDIDKWLSCAIFPDKIPTGWTHVDNVLGGGLGTGQLGIILGPQGRGKSTALLNIGFNAACLGLGKNVVFITHEMSENEVTQRFAARLTGMFPRKNQDVSDYKEILARYLHLVPGNFRVIGHGRKQTTSEIENQLNVIYYEDGYKFDMIIDDYGGLIISNRKYKERRFEIRDNYEWLRDLGNKWGVPVWTGSQTNRPALSSPTVTLEMFADDISKAATADVVISVCRTVEEQQNNTGRLYMIKVRNGRSNVMVVCNWKASSMLIRDCKVIEQNSNGKWTDYLNNNDIDSYINRPKR